MPGSLWGHLVFDVDRGHAGALKLADSAGDVDGVAVAGFGIADDRYINRVGDFTGAIDYFGKGQQSGVGEAEGTVLSTARNMHEGKAEPLDQARLNAVVTTRRDVTDRFFDERG